MNRAELVREVAKITDLTIKDTEATLDAFIDTVAQVLAKNEKLTLVGFGSFEVSKRAARTGRNPKTGEEIKIPASITPKFKAGKALKEAVAKK